MKRLLLFIIPIILTVSTIRADLVSGPRTSFLWNQFNSIAVLDSFALATSDFGVALLKLDPETGIFTPDTTVLLSNQALSIKVSDYTAVVRTAAGIASFLDLSSLPTLTLIGEADLGMNVEDAALVDNDLYLACGYSGLRHYSLVGNDSLVFVDSSLAPVHCVQVEFDDPYLIVLDDYNGLIRYQPESAGIGPPLSMVRVPRQVDRFDINGDTLILLLARSPLAYRVLFEPSAVLIDSISFSFIPDGTFAIDSLIAAIDIENGLLETISTTSGTRVLVPYELAPGLTTNGDTYYRGDDPCLVLISQSRGLLSFNLAELSYDASLRSVYTRPGPVRGLAFHEGRLATGGTRNPIELFSVDLEREPHSDAAFFNEPQVAAIVDGGDVLLSYSSSTRRISASRFLGDSITIVSNIPALSPSVHKLVFQKDPMPDGSHILLAIGTHFFDVISVSANGTLSRGLAGRHDVLNDILDALILDTVVLVSTTDSQLRTYKINSSVSLTYTWSVGTPVDLDHMVMTGIRGIPGGWEHHSLNLAFGGPNMYEIYLRPPHAEPRIYSRATLPVEVTNSVVGHNVIYTIGPGSCGLLDLSYEIPVMTSFGGYGGDYIAVHDSILVTSDGSAIHLYQVPGESIPTGIDDDRFVSLLPTGLLHQNYPNPFNPQTTISFELPRRMPVELTIYDVLGRQVIALLNGELPPGTHSIEWRGNDASGGRVASGVYFYRLTADGTSESRKMVHLK